MGPANGARGEQPGKHQESHLSEPFEFFTIRFVVEFEQAWELAQLLKRIGWSECRALANCGESEGQCRLMLEAIEQVREGLCAKGFDPR